MNTQIPEISSSVLIALAILVIVEVALVILALVRVIRASDDQIRRVPLFNDYSRVFWILLSLLVNTVGAIVTLVFAVKPASVSEKEVSDMKSQGETVDMLYSSPSDSAEENR